MSSFIRMRRPKPHTVRNCITESQRAAGTQSPALAGNKGLSPQSNPVPEAAAGTQSPVLACGLGLSPQSGPVRTVGQDSVPSPIRSEPARASPQSPTGLCVAYIGGVHGETSYVRSLGRHTSCGQRGLSPQS